MPFASELAEQAERLGIVLPESAIRARGTEQDDSISPKGVVKALHPRLSEASALVARTIGRPRKAFCLNGHDLSVTRRIVNGKAKDCRVCHSDRIRNLRQRMRELEQELDRVRGVA